jgi:hypothetical protein
MLAQGGLILLSCKALTLFETKPRIVMGHEIAAGGRAAAPSS